MTHVATITGRLMDLKNPDVDDIRTVDIVHSLCKINRFNGHTEVPYTVAHHTVAMCNYLQDEDEIRSALIHDMHEYVLGDVTSPLKAVLGPAYTELATLWDLSICQKYGVEHHKHEHLMHTSVGVIDQYFCDAEIIFLIPRYMGNGAVVDNDILECVRAVSSRQGIAHEMYELVDRYLTS